MRFGPLQDALITDATDQPGPTGPDGGRGGRTIGGLSVGRGPGSGSGSGGGSLSTSTLIFEAGASVPPIKPPGISLVSIHSIINTRFIL
jgi:hypothetical protein